MIQSPYKLYLTCPKGFETVCSQELKSIGIQHRKIESGGVSFSGNMDDIYKVNYLSRTGMVLWLEICNLNTKNEQSIYDSILRNNWNQLFQSNSTFSFKCIQRGKQFKNTHFLALKGKDAIVDYFINNNLPRPNVEKSDADLNFLILVDKHNGKLLLNTSGAPLFKRGYRTVPHDAPLNETVAACILKSTGWNSDIPLYDPFCGSGTIPIEAVRLAKNIPSGILRKKWGFSSLPEFNKSNWNDIKENENSKIDSSINLEIHGSDIQNFCIQSSKIHAKHANVLNDIKFRNTDVNHWVPFTDNGMIITNPPYGVRLNQFKNLSQLFSDFGDILKNHCEGFKAFLICGNREFIKNIGLKTSLKMPLRIGKLDGRLVGFELYKGSKKRN